MLEIKKKDLSVEYSNHVWQCDHTRADVLLVDRDRQILGRPWLTRVIDTYSRCIVGINLGCDAPSSQVVALALRHAILRHKPKQQPGQPPTVPVAYIQIPQECGAKELFGVILEHLKYQVVEGTIAEIPEPALQEIR